MKRGYSIHCHHNVLWEYCYDYNGRVDAIKCNKPKNEQEVRLKLFKLLPQEAIDELPGKLVEADAEWQKADAKWLRADAKRQKVDAEWQKVDAKRQKVDDEWQEAYAGQQKAYAEWWKAYAEWQEGEAERQEAYAEWWKAGGVAWHKKWCGCSYWNGEEIIFDKGRK